MSDALRLCLPAPLRGSHYFCVPRCRPASCSLSPSQRVLLSEPSLHSVSQLHVASDATAKAQRHLAQVRHLCSLALLCPCECLVLGCCAFVLVSSRRRRLLTSCVPLRVISWRRRLRTSLPACAPSPRARCVSVHGLFAAIWLTWSVSLLDAQRLLLLWLPSCIALALRQLIRSWSLTKLLSAPHALHPPFLAY